MIKLGKMTLNKNPTNFFAEPESISFAPSTVVKGITFVPDPLLQWRLMSYDDTSTHRHNSPNGYLLPINRAIAPVDNNYRDGYMQPLLFEGASTSSPDNIGGVVGAGPAAALPYTGSVREDVNGQIGRYAVINDFFGQARTFWAGLDQFAQQHAVDAYRFEVGHTSPPVQQEYINTILNNIDNCLARRVAFGIGAPLPALGSGSTANGSTTFPSLYPLAPGQETNKSNAGLVIGILANDNLLSSSDLSGILPALASHQVSFEVVAPHMGALQTGVMANQSFITTSSIFYDAIIVGSILQQSNSANATQVFVSAEQEEFLREAYSHGKAIGTIGTGRNIFDALGYKASGDLGIFEGGASTVALDILTALSGPVRFPQRFPVDDPSICQ
jgi:catalase